MQSDLIAIVGTILWFYLELIYKFVIIGGTKIPFRNFLIFGPITFFEILNQKGSSKWCDLLVC